MQRILLATGLEAINNVINTFEEFEVIGVTNYKEKVIDKIEELNPDTVVLSNFLSGQGNITELTLNIVQKFNNIRIVFLTEDLDFDDIESVNKLGTLVLAGVYDIMHQSKIKKGLLRSLLLNRKTKEDVLYLTKYLNNNVGIKNAIEIEDSGIEEEPDDYIKNVFTVSSVKPGTGKTFVSANLATIIAKFGKLKNGKRPKVALIEADLQTLSLGTILQIEDSKKNLKSVMDKISTILSPEGDLIANEIQIEEVNKYIKSCFKPYYTLKNLQVLSGSELTMKEVEDITPQHYVYLVEVISREFDVVIIDTNSSLVHITTNPLLQMANTCYYVLNLDFNNVRNNSRYREDLRDLGVLNKVKYILNQDVTNMKNNGSELEKLKFDKNLLSENFKLEAEIPNLPQTIFLNRLYEGVPVGIYDKPYTARVRYELSKVANQICEIENLDMLRMEAEEYEEIQKKK